VEKYRLVLIGFKRISQASSQVAIRSSQDTAAATSPACGVTQHSQIEDRQYCIDARKLLFWELKTYVYQCLAAAVEMSFSSRDLCFWHACLAL